jgi:hypothetical protein
MPEDRSRLSAVLLTYFPMFIATLSLCGSILHAYLFTRSIDAAQRNVARGEYLRTCKDLIDGYFQAKLKISVVAARAAA